MSAPDWRGIRIGVTAAPDSYRYHLRRRRLARLRRALVRPDSLGYLALCMALLTILGVATDWQAARTILHFVQGAN